MSTSRSATVLTTIDVSIASINAITDAVANVGTTHAAGAVTDGTGSTFSLGVIV